MDGWYVGADRELLLLVLPLPLDQPPYRALLGARVCTEYVCVGVAGVGQHKRRGVTLGVMDVTRSNTTGDTRRL